MKKIILAIFIASLSVSLNAESLIINDMVQVIKSKPIYENVIKRVPYQECWNEQVPYNENSSNSNVGSLIGGIAGGILGHQVGGGGGKTVATIGGAILGAIVGNNLSNNHQKTYSGYKTVQKCVTKYNESHIRTITQYKNIGFYDGNKIIKYSNAPLQYIPIEVIIKY